MTALDLEAARELCAERDRLGALPGGDFDTHSRLHSVRYKLSKIVPALLDALATARAERDAMRKALESCARVGRDLSPSVRRQELYSAQNWKDAALDAGRRLTKIAAAALSSAGEGEGA